MNMENRDNVVFMGQYAANRPFWSFRYPHEVVRDSSLSLEDKRAILAAWASDANTVDSFPTLRHLPGTPCPVTFSSIMDARANLDRLAGFDDDEPPLPPAASGRAVAVSYRQAA